MARHATDSLLHSTTASRPAVWPLLTPFVAFGVCGGSLFTPRVRPEDSALFLAVGACFGAFVGWRAARAASRSAFLLSTAAAGAAAGAAIFFPFARENGAPFLCVAGACAGAFLALPLWILALPTFATRRWAESARGHSMVRQAGMRLTVSAAVFAVVLLAWAGHPKLLRSMDHGTALDFSRPVLYVATTWLAVAFFLGIRGLRAFERAVRAPALYGNPPDIGIGDESVVVTQEAADPYRSLPTTHEVMVGDVKRGRRALVFSLVVDVAILVAAIAILASGIPLFASRAAPR